MKELSLNILDITENSTKAGATLVFISLTETENTLHLRIADNGCGMKPDFLASVTDPFTTTRTTRKVGMGIPLLKLAAEQTGGSFSIRSKDAESFPDDHGTVTEALFFTDHLDFTPLGDVISTMTTLIQGHPAVDFVYDHTSPSLSVHLDTRELREVLGGVPLDSFEVILWIRDYLGEQYGIAADT